MEEADLSSAPLDAPEALSRAIRVDKLGRRWEVAAVDPLALDALLASYDQATAVPPHADEPAQASISHEDAPGEVTYHSWNTIDCSGETYKAWDTDDRDVISDSGSDPLTARQKTVVEVATAGFLFSTCSAVVVDDDYVLTAAHCISTDGTHPHSPGGFVVCSKGGWRYSGTCRAIDAFIPYPDWSGSNDMKHDIGLIELDPAYSFSSDVEEMVIASTSEQTLESLTKIHPLAYPGYTGTSPCDYNPAWDASTSTWGMYMTRQAEDEITHITNKKIGTRLDGGPGHSGAPIYFCPEGTSNDCQEGDRGFVIGVWSGWYNGGTVKYNGGPKVPYYRTWLLGLM